MRGDPLDLDVLQRRLDGLAEPLADPLRVAGDLEAGATWVLTEGRESGTVGLYEPDGSVRVEVVETLVARVGLSRLIFEAPRKDQQAWFINRFGSEVNLGNVVLDDAIGVEALRLGLRADTIGLSVPSDVEAEG